MGKRGPAPKPTELQRLAGNPGHRPLPRGEPHPERGAPSRPDWLLPEAKREWARVVPELDRLGLLTKIDRAALAAYCQCYGRLVQVEKILRSKGLTFKTPNGYIQQRPEVSIAHKERALLRTYCHEFGLSPSARVGLATGEAEDESGAVEQFTAFMTAAARQSDHRTAKREDDDA